MFTTDSVCEVLTACVLEDNVDDLAWAGSTFRKLSSQLNSIKVAPTTFPLAKESNTKVDYSSSLKVGFIQNFIIGILIEDFR